MNCLMDGRIVSLEECLNVSGTNASSTKAMHLTANVIFTTTYGVLGWIAYFIIFGVLLCNRKAFNSPYYTLFLISAVLNFFTYINGQLALRLPPITNRGSTLSSIFECGHFFGLEAITAGIQLFGYFQYGMSTLIAVNRTMTLYRPFDHELLWKKWFKPMLFCVFAVPLALNYDIFSYHSEYIYILSGDYYLLTSSEPTGRGILKMLIYMIISTISNVILNGACVYKAWNRKTRAVNSNENLEIKLLIHSILVFSCEIVAVSITVMLYLKPLNPIISYYGMLFVQYASDALTVLTPNTIFYFCTDLRHKIFFCCSPKTKVQVLNAQLSVSSGIKI